MHRVTLISGDGTGPEVIAAAQAAVEAAGISVEWDEQIAGADALKQMGTPLPGQTLASIKQNKVCLKGPVTTPVGGGFRSVNVEMRKQLGLYAGVRPCRSMEGIDIPFKDVDIVVMRENTEDVYAGIEYESGSQEAGEVIRNHPEILNSSAITLKPISPHASHRIAKFAQEYAKDHKRKKISIIHKANIMKATDGLWLKECQKALERSGLEVESRIVDNMALHLVQKPQSYDMLLCQNLYGDILSDLCAGLVGGLGVVPGANIGDKYAIFEPVHGSAPKYAGQDKVNPAAAVLSAALMLRHIGEKAAAQKIERAVEAVVKEGKSLTYDIAKKKPVGTRQMADAITRKIS